MEYLSNPTIFRRSVLYTSAFVIILWTIKGYEWLSGDDLGYLGLYPLSTRGALGIFTSPLIHGDPFHLLNNTFPLIMLGIGLFYFYYRIAKKVFIWIYFLTGIGVWIIARQAYHIGASGIIYGMLSFLFFIGLFNKDNRSIIISLIVLFLYGGMISGLFPSDQRVSYESHIMGAFVGLLVAFNYRKQPLDDREITSKTAEEARANRDMDVPHFSRPDHTHYSSQTRVIVHYKEKSKP